MPEKPKLKAGPWPSRARFEVWWEENRTEFNQLSTEDPEQWEEIAKQVEKFQKDNPQ